MTEGPTRGAAATASRVAHALLAVALLAGPALAQVSDDGRVREVVHSMARPLTGVPGDPARGRGIAMNRDLGNCTLCHTLPGMEASVVPGDVGPPLAGVGARLGAAELRLRLVDSTRINPESVMPAYHRTDHLAQVAAAYRSKPVLTAQELEDVIAYLQGLH